MPRDAVVTADDGPPDEVAQLRTQLAEAVAAAREAYRHTTGLIRLLTVLGQPATPEDLIEETLTLLSEVFSADVTAVARMVDGKLLVRASCGLPEDDPAFREGWPVTREAARVFDRTGTAPGDHHGGSGSALPPPLDQLGARSAAWIPYGSDGGDELLLLYRRASEPFSPVDVEVLRSVAYRLRLSVEVRERSTAIERLAESGHLLARHLEIGPLLTEAAELLRRLTSASSAWVVTVDASAEGLIATIRASSGHTQHATPRRPAQELPGWSTLGRGHPYVDNHPTTHQLAPAQALLGIPVDREDSTPTTLLYATRDRSRPFNRDAVDMAVIFGNYLGVAMTNAELHRALVRSEAWLRERATHDPLTGLANRVLAGQRLDEALVHPGEDHVGLLFCDLDLFKAVNDRFGHEAGDLLLQQVAARLKDGVRATDLLARIGGDEFVVILDGVNDLAEVAEIGRRVLSTLDAPFWVEGVAVRISASVGGVLGVRGEATANAMLRDADAAMFIAKDRGPGQLEVLPTP